MAKKNIAGVAGNCTLAGFNAKINSWSGSYVIHDEEVTGFDSGGFDEYEPIGVGMSGSATGTIQYDDTTTTPIPLGLADGSALAVGDLESAKVAAVLTEITGCTWTGTVLMSNVAIVRPAKGKASITFDFKFTGAFTKAHDQTA